MKYIGYFSSEVKELRRYGQRESVLSATNKMSYIIDVLSSNGQVEIVSACGVKKHTGGGTAGLVNMNENVSLRFFYGINKKNKIMSFLSDAFLKIQLFFFLLLNTKKDEIILVYHSPSYCSIIRWIKKLTGCRLILEMEEVYADVNESRLLRKREMRLSSYADAFLFPSKLMNEIINQKHKPYVIVHGTYRVEPYLQSVALRDLDKGMKNRIINCVYAGTFDRRKGGVSAAVSAAEFLPSQYHIHIIGFGSKEDTEQLLSQIEAVNNKSSAVVYYDGKLSGEEYKCFLQCCDIGLSTQNPEGAFNDTSFPSKVLSYLANGLRVVSCRISAVEQSSVGGKIYYYDSQEPECIAEAIKKVDLNDEYDGRELVSNLDQVFRRDIKALLDK